MGASNHIVLIVQMIISGCDQMDVEQEKPKMGCSRHACGGHTNAPTFAVGRLQQWQWPAAAHSMACSHADGLGCDWSKAI